MPRLCTDLLEMPLGGDACSNGHFKKMTTITEIVAIVSTTGAGIPTNVQARERERNMQSGPEPVLQVATQLMGLHQVLSALKEELIFEAVKIRPCDLNPCRQLCRLPGSGGIVFYGEREYYNLSYHHWCLFLTICSL
jgi:hypothetical protein